jgi:hypothetical protein
VNEMSTLIVSTFVSQILVLRKITSFETLLDLKFNLFLLHVKRHEILNRAQSEAQAYGMCGCVVVLLAGRR